MNCKVTKTPNSTPIAHAVLRLTGAGEALYESLKRIAVEPPRFALALQVGAMQVQCTAFAETVAALHSRLESVCLCHGVPVKTTPTYTCASEPGNLLTLSSVLQVRRIT